MKKILLILLFSLNIVYGAIKDRDSNDVYALAESLKNKITHLTGEKKLHPNYMKLPQQYNKSPRHVFQKTLEVLTKINKYRQLNNLGEVNIPIYPSRSIDSEDVYFNVKRLNSEIGLLLKKIDCPHALGLSVLNNYTNKTSNDSYYEVWLASLAMDELLGKGFSPVDNYKQSALIVDTIMFIRNSQGMYDEIEMPKKKSRKHPNHVLYATNKLLKEISHVEKKLWMQAVDVPQNPQKIITPTEVYDSMQIVITELIRIRRRLGVERFYEAQEIIESKTPSDVLQNIEYAIKLLPTFELNQNIIQYNRKSLVKTFNEMYSLSEFILEKIKYLKEVKGIKVASKKISMIYNLHTMHIYQKGIETMEKINKLRLKDKLYEVAVPQSPIKQKSTDDVYELLLMIDNEISIIMERNGIKDVQRWSYVLDKKTYANKNPSHVYNNLWKISSIIDILRGTQYTPNDIYILANKMEQRIENITKYLIGQTNKINHKKNFEKRSDDVFRLSLKLYELLIQIEKRANITIGVVDIPKEKNISTDTVYNALRVINATLIDINIHFGIESIVKDVKLDTKKDFSDVYDVIDKSYIIIQKLLKDTSYEG